jgi:hypothetical protein
VQAPDTYSNAGNKQGQAVQTGDDSEDYPYAGDHSQDAEYHIDDYVTKKKHPVLPASGAAGKLRVFFCYYLKKNFH